MMFNLISLDVVVKHESKIEDDELYAEIANKADSFDISKHSPVVEDYECPLDHKTSK